MAALLIRRPVISSDHLGPLLNIISWMAMVCMCLTVLTVLLSKYLLIRKFNLDDVLITASMAFGILQTIAISIAVSHGLGDTIYSNIPREIDAFQKAVYASRQLYILALVFAKTSTLALLWHLTPNKWHRKLIWVVTVSVGVWTVCAMVPSLFLCALPHPWSLQDNKCVDIVAFWIAIGTFDILTEIAIMALPIYVILGLQLSYNKKYALCFAFGFRTLTIATIICRLAFASRVYNSADKPLATFPFAVSTQLQITLGVFACCVPHLRPFMESLDVGFLSGVVRVDDSLNSRRPNELRPGRIYDSPFSAIKTSSTNGMLAYDKNGTLSGKSSFDDRQNLAGMADRSSKAYVTSRAAAKESEGSRSHDSAGSQAMLIKPTTEWRISYDEP